MMKFKWNPDAFYFPSSFITGCLISFISVTYMSLQAFQWVAEMKDRTQNAYANVYEVMYGFFRNGNK